MHYEANYDVYGGYERQIEKAERCKRIMLNEMPINMMVKIMFGEYLDSQTPSKVEKIYEDFILRPFTKEVNE